MSGDPVEESGQAVRQGFVQMLQTAHTTSALIRGSGGEGRSRAESDQRIEFAAARNQRSHIEHQARLGGLGWERQLTAAKIDEVRERIANNQKVTDAEVRLKEGQITRAETDLARREKAGDLENHHNTETHQHRIAGYRNREARATQLHELDVEYKTLLIEIRRRAAGFTETLHHTESDTGRGMAAAAQFAAADATADLSPEHQTDADAYRERFAADTGLNPEDLLDADQHAHVADGRPPGLDDAAGLAEDLTTAAHLAHEFGAGIGALEHRADPDNVIVDAEVLDTGEGIGTAVAATAVHDIDSGAPDPGLIADAVPSARGPGKEIEVWRGVGPDS
ncbi:hypothetical protein ACFWPX_03285 [Nocardia sp. NPDC058518]|uniref:hypothetical protein n=1 Tax=Nocardia sp. NPDC058518 TaxID=3346534 RepID=UPI00365153B3